MNIAPGKKRKARKTYYKPYLSTSRLPEDQGEQVASTSGNRSARYKPYLTERGGPETEFAALAESPLNVTGSTAESSDEGNINNSDSDSPSDHDEIAPSDVENVADHESEVESDLESNKSEVSDTQPLYEGSKIDLNSAISSILDFYISNSLSKSALSDLLSLLQNLLPQPNVLPNSKFKLDKFILQNAPSADHIKHYYCSSCHNYIGTVDNETLCPCCGGENTKSFFLMYNLKSLLKNFLENGKTHQYLKSATSSSDTVSDIHDGSCLKKSNQTLHFGPYDLNLILNTDGAPVFKSSKSQLWPLQFSFAELPPEIRHKYVLVAGIWYGKEKPDMNTFLKPLAENLAELSVEGVKWCIPGTQTIVESRVFAPVVCLDAPARAAVMNIHQFNGEFGCNICEKKGTQIQCGQGTSRIYEEESESSPLRTKDEMVHNAVEAVERGKVVKGVKGPSILSTLMYFNIAQAFVPDYMHCVLLGVVRQLLFLWLNPSFKQFPWCLSKNVNVMNSKLKAIKTPSEISRAVRGLDERKYWKASEFRSWLLFYSLPTLSNVLPEKYLQHWILLVFSIFTLLKDKISQVELKLCSIALRNFCENIGNLYGQEQLTFNVHQLTHLPLSVARWGPLWATSAFMFENNNGVLLKLIHGTQQVSMQIINSFKYINGLCVLESKIDKNYSLLSKSMSSVIPGKVLKSRPKLLAIETRIICTFLNCNIDKVEFMSKCTVSKTLYTSLIYERSKIRNNCLVMYNFWDTDKSKMSTFIGFIKLFFFAKDSKQDIFCVIKRHELRNNIFKNKDYSIEIDHIKSITSHHTRLDVVPALNISKKLIFLNNEMVGIMPNLYETNL